MLNADAEAARRLAGAHSHTMGPWMKDVEVPRLLCRCLSCNASLMVAKEGPGFFRGTAITRDCPILFSSIGNIYDDPRYEPVPGELT